MSRQIDFCQEPSAVALEDRLRRLEHQVAALSEAVLLLAHEFEDSAMDESGNRPSDRAVRKANDLLLVARGRTGADG